MTYGTLLGDDEEDISIHTALAGCDDNISFTSPGGHISIHTALAGCDRENVVWLVDYYRFQSTQPSQAVTRFGKSIFLTREISIHTALAGCDEMGQDYCQDCGISIHTALAGCDQ